MKNRQHKVSKKDWIILRLLRCRLRAGALKYEDWRDVNNAALHLFNTYGWKTFDAAVTALEQEEANNVRG
jgi:hypothetical protein